MMVVDGIKELIKQDREAANKGHCDAPACHYFNGRADGLTIALGFLPPNQRQLLITKSGDIKPLYSKELEHAVTYALNAVEEHLVGSTIDWSDVALTLKNALGEGE